MPHYPRGYWTVESTRMQRILPGGQRDELYRLAPNPPPRELSVMGMRYNYPGVGALGEAYTPPDIPKSVTLQTFRGVMKGQVGWQNPNTATLNHRGDVLEIANPADSLYVLNVNRVLKKVGERTTTSDRLLKPGENLFTKNEEPAGANHDWTVTLKSINWSDEKLKEFQSKSEELATKAADEAAVQKQREAILTNPALSEQAKQVELKAFEARTQTGASPLGGFELSEGGKWGLLGLGIAAVAAVGLYFATKK